MPNLPFDFTGVADAQGHVNITRSVPIGPLRIRITKFAVRTQSGCRNRKHHLKVHINGDAIFHGMMQDCHPLVLHSDRAWQGVIQISFNADGFDAGEHVHGHGDVEFVVTLL
jgi:hypothetical protein